MEKEEKKFIKRILQAHMNHGIYFYKQNKPYIGRENKINMKLIRFKLYKIYFGNVIKGLDFIR